MFEARGLIELVVCIHEPQPPEEASRSRILWIVTCEQGLDAEDVESILDYTCSCFECVTSSPVPGRDVDAEFGNPWLPLAWPKTAAADVLPACEEEYGPILNAVGFVRGQLLPKPVPNFSLCEAPR